MTYLAIPQSENPRFYRWFATDDTDLARGEVCKMTSNKPEAIGADESGELAGIVNSVKTNQAGNVTDVELYFGPTLKLPIAASHHVPGLGDPVYMASKTECSADGAGVAANATSVGRANKVSGSAGAGYVWIDCVWSHWDVQAADAS